MRSKRPKEIGSPEFHADCVRMYDERIALMEAFQRVVQGIQNTVPCRR